MLLKEECNFKIHLVGSEKRFQKYKSGENEFQAVIALQQQRERNLEQEVS